MSVPAKLRTGAALATCGMVITIESVTTFRAAIRSAVGFRNQFGVYERMMHELEYGYTLGNYLTRLIDGGRVPTFALVLEAFDAKLRDTVILGRLVGQIRDKHVRPYRCWDGKWA